MKKCWLLLLLMGCFLFGSQEVQAGTGIYVTIDKLKANGVKINRKYIHFQNGNKGDTQAAYCSDKNKNIFTSPKYLMKLDSSYKKKYCMYGNTGKLKRAKCATIVGYVISTAIKNGENIKVSGLTANHWGWYWGQMALWVYLSEYGYDEKANINGKPQFHFANTRVSSKWKKNKTIKDMLKIAFNKLDDAKVEQSTDSSSVQDIITVSGVNGSEISLKNVTGEGKNITYKSDVLTIKNNNNQKITISFDLDKDINVYSSNGTPIQGIFDIPPKGEHKIYLESGTYYNLSNFSIHAEYSGTTKTEKIAFSSRLYIYAKECIRIGSCTGGDGAGQGMIVLENNVDNKITNVTYEDDEKFTVVMPKLITRNCKPSAAAAGYSSAKKSPANISDGKCAAFSDNGTTSNEKLTANYYQYYGCDNGDTITIKNGSNEVKVSYILVEVATFSYGNLSPNEVYAGQGFEISGENQLNTEYSDMVWWDYKYYLEEKNGSLVPYLNGVTEKEAEKAINKAIKDDMQNTLDSESNDSGLLMVKAQSPNDDKIRAKDDNKRTNIQKPLVKLDASKKNTPEISIDSNKKLSYTSLLLFPTVYLNIAGKVIDKDSNGSYSDTKTNFYYTPLDRNFSGTSNQTTFDFTIYSGLEKGLSLTRKFDFKFSGDCEGKIKYGNITYRSVDVNNPFPRNTSVNWENWITQNRKEKENRLKKSYDAGKLEYSVTLSRTEMEGINEKYTNRYDDWETTINEHGISSFVSDNVKKEGKAAYNVCDVGKLDSKCSDN